MRVSVERQLAYLFKNHRVEDTAKAASPITGQVLEAFAQATRIRPNVVAGFTNPLSLKELLILMLNGAGKSGREIGAIFGFSPLTVQKYEWRTRKKLNTRSRIHSFCEAVIRGYLIILP